MNNVMYIKMTNCFFNNIINQKIVSNSLENHAKKSLQIIRNTQVTSRNKVKFITIKIIEFQVVMQ